MNPLCPQLKQTYHSLLLLKDAFNAELKEAKRTGDFTKLEELRLEILEKQDFIESHLASAKIRWAEKEFGENFFGVQAIETTFGFTPEHIPPIPFSKQELQRAKELKQMLILQVNTFPDGTPLTGKIMHEKFGMQKNGNKFFLRVDDYENGPFFTTESPREGWVLATPNILQNSTKQNYLEQTDTLIDYLTTKVFQGNPPKEYREAIEAFENSKSKIEALGGKTLSGTEYHKNWKEIAEILAELNITELIRDTFVEVAYRLQIVNKKGDRNLFEETYSWTGSRDSGGCFVNVGDFGSDGADVGGSGPGYSVGILGVSFSRRV